MDPEVDAEVSFHDVAKKLEIKILSSKEFSKFQSHEAVIRDERSFSVNVQNAYVLRIIEDFTTLAHWLAKADKHKQRVCLTLDNSNLIASLEEIKTNEQTFNPSVRKDKLLLIDGSNLLHIGYFATKASAMRNSQGMFTNAVFAFTRTFLNLIKQLQPTHVALCFDKGRETFRNTLYTDYKAHREKKDEELVQQFGITRELIKKMNVIQFDSGDYEADDLLGTLSKRWSEEKNNHCYIVSNDHDLYQLLTPNVFQVTLKKGQMNLYGQENFEKEYEIKPGQWIDVKALLGDTSDNIPGVKGVGEKAAVPLIQKYGSIENLYENLEEIPDSKFNRYYYALQYGKEKGFLSKTLATIITNVPEVASVDLESLKLNVDKKAMISEFQRLQFNSILQQIKQGVYRVS